MIENILILAAGKGTRLLPLTQDVPKPLLKIDCENTTILGRLISQCNQYFPKVPIYVNVSYLSEKFFEAALAIPLDMRPTFLYEKEVLGPAKTLTQFSKLRNGRNLVIHGDLVLSNNGFMKFAEFALHSSSQMLVCHKRSKSMARSEVKISPIDGKMLSISERNNSLNFGASEGEEISTVSSGIFIINSENLSQFQAIQGESLAPRLLNFVNIDALEIFIWDDWRFAVDSISTLQLVKLKLSSDLAN